MKGLDILYVKWMFVWNKLIRKIIGYASYIKHYSNKLSEWHREVTEQI